MSQSNKTSSFPKNNNNNNNNNNPKNKQKQKPKGAQVLPTGLYDIHKVAGGGVAHPKPQRVRAARKPRPRNPQGLVKAGGLGPDPEIVKSLGDPATTPVTRYGSAFSSTRTAAVAFQDTENISSATLPGQYHVVGDIVALQFRDALRHTVTMQDSTGLMDYSIWMKQFQEAVEIAQTPPPSKSVDIDSTYFDVPLPIAYATSNQPYSPHGPVLFCGADPLNSEGGERFIWIDGGVNVQGAVTDIDVDCAGTLVLSRWTPGGEERDIIVLDFVGPPADVWTKNSKYAAEDNNSVCSEPTPLAISKTRSRAHRVRAKYPIRVVDKHSHRPRAPQVVDALVVIPGYYSFHWVNAGATNPFGATGFTLNLTNQGLPAMTHYCHKPIPGMFTNMSSVDNIRILACSLLLSNRTPDLTAGGNIYAKQVPSKVDWIVWLGDKNISNTNDYFSSPLKKGCYGFLKPESETDFDLRTHFTLNDDGVLCDSFYPLLSEFPYLLMKGNAGEDPTTSKFTGIIESAVGIEYSTENKWIATVLPQSNREAYEASVEVLRTVPQFNENPIHLKALVSNIAKGILKYGPQAIGLAKAFA